MRRRVVAKAILTAVFWTTALNSSGTPSLPVLLGMYGSINELIAADNWLAANGAAGISIAGDFIDFSLNPAYNVPNQLNLAWNAGFVPFVNVMPPNGNPACTALGISQGNCDLVLKEFATHFKAWANGGQRRAYLAPLPEMNGNWTWSWYQSQDPETFKLAFRRIRQVFEDQAVPRSSVRWVFAPNGWPATDLPDGKIFEHYYPGDAYVDAVAFSAYNYGGCPPNEPWFIWDTFETAIKPYLDRMRLMAPAKEIFLAQTGSVNVPKNPANAATTENRSYWIQDTFQKLGDYPGFRGIVYFNHTKQENNLPNCPVVDYRFYLQSTNTGEAGLIAVMKDPRLGKWLNTNQGWTTVLFSDNPPAPACTYTVSAPQTVFSQAVGAGTLQITASQAACGTAITGIPPWLAFAQASGTGSRTAGFTVAANGGAARSAILTIGGTATITISQSGTPVQTGFVPLTPCRVLETRTPYTLPWHTGSFGPPALAGGGTRTLPLPGVCGIPAGAKAYVLNVTLIPRGSLSFATLWEAGESRPEAWSARSLDGQIVANTAIVKAGANGAINAYVSDTTDMVIDISGYFTDNPGVSRLAYFAMTPCRVLDTRIAYRTPPGPFGPPSLQALQTRRFRFPATPYCTVPAGAAAYSVTLTVVPPARLDFVTAWPGGATQPTISNINSFAGRTLANNIIVPASGDGSIDVFPYNTTDILIDINGYFAPDDGINGLFFTPFTTCRIADTTNAGYTGSFGPPVYENESTHTIPIQTTTRCPAMPNAKAYVISATVLPNGSSMPYLTMWPTGGPRPQASQMNAFEGQIATNTAIVPSGTNGSINVFVYRRTNVVLELSGFFSR